MVKVLTAGGRGTDLPIGPVYFSRDYVRRGWFTSTTYSQGRRGVILRSHKFLGRQTHHVDHHLGSRRRCPSSPSTLMHLHE